MTAIQTFSLATEPTTAPVRSGPPGRTFVGMGAVLALLLVYPFALPSVFYTNIGILALTFATGFAAFYWGSRLFDAATGQAIREA